MTEYSNGSYDLTGVAAGTITATLAPGATDVSFSLVGVLSTFDISSQAGATVTVDNTVEAGSALNLDTNGGAIILDNSTLVSLDALGAVDVTIDGGSFSLSADLINANVLTSGSIAFGSSGGTDFITGTTGVDVSLLSRFAPITGFLGTSDVIDDQELRWTGSTSYTITGSDTIGGVETIVVTQGGNTFSFATEGSELQTGTFNTLTGGPLRFTEDVNGGTDIAVCFARGTRIATAKGPTAVESLRIGDLVTTLRGDQLVSRPIKWMGWRRIDLNFHPQPEMVAPVRIRRDAFGPNSPHADLLVSPDHAIFVDEMLICARQLVNDATIVREKGLLWVDYFHVELDEHSILLAEGLPTESYLDTGNRGFFANAREVLILHPNLDDESDNPIRQATSCAPFVWDESRVKPVWDRLAARAARMGQPAPTPTVTLDPELCLVVQGRTHRPVSAADGRYTFVVCKGVNEVRLVSSAGLPTDSRPWLDDRRRLGVMVERIVLRSGADVREVPVDLPDLHQGWWAVEQSGVASHRWTNGDAILPLPLTTSVAVLEIHARPGGMSYLVNTDGQRHAA
jgi:hypothetical protein